MPTAREDIKQLNKIASWFQKNISRSIGSKTASIYTDRFKSQAGDLLATGRIKSGEKAFLKVYKTFHQDILGSLICGWVVMVLKTYEKIKRKIDPNAKLWWLVRDAYPGMWVAELISPMMGLETHINQAIHINKLNLGIKDEVDVWRNTLISKNPEDYINLKRYVCQNIGSAKVIVIADSLQYGYMTNTLCEGEHSFIIQASNGAEIWKNGRMPKEVLRGIIPKEVTLLPLSLYSHLCGSEFGDTVPAYLNYLAMVAGYDLNIYSSVKPKLEALADAVEAIICDHEPVLNFKIKDKILEPNIVSIDSPLAHKFAQAAKEGIVNTASKLSQLIVQEDWEGFLADQIRHLNHLLNELEKVHKGGLSLAISATAPKLSKRQELFNYILKLKQQNRDWLGIQDLTKYIFKFKK